MSVNDFEDVISIAKIDYSKGLGFGSITLDIDGAALQDFLSSKKKTTLKGIVEIEVKDKSILGQTKKFKINIEALVISTQSDN